MLEGLIADLKCPLYEILDKAKQLEASAKFDPRFDKKKGLRLDLQIRAEDGQELLIDVAVVHDTAPSYVKDALKHAERRQQMVDDHIPGTVRGNKNGMILPQPYDE